jgi:HK97 gp10 family phage protein
MTATMAIRGDRELIRTLEKMAGKDAKKAMRKGCRAGSKVVAKRAKQLAPRRSGAIRRAIRVRAVRSRKIGTQVIVGAGWFKGKTFYAAFVEFGHKAGKRGRSGRTTVPGQHYMQRAGEEAGEKALATAVDTMWSEIEAMAK